MQVGHRFNDMLLERSGGAGATSLAEFHLSLLNVLPHAAAFVAPEGGLLAGNAAFRDACVARGVSPQPASLRDLFGEDGWRRCEALLSSAFAGVPAEESGPVPLSTGAAFCEHLSCTAALTIAADQRAVLVQFGIGGDDRDDRDARAVAQMTGMSGLLDHFPDDVVLFDGSETPLEQAIMLLETIGGDHDPAELAEALARLGSEGGRGIHLPEQGQASGHGGERRMCEIRLVRLPRPAGGAGRTRPAMAIIRRNVDCPREAAENRRLAYLDPLTGLENRRAFTRTLTRELERREKDGGSLAVFYIDLDEFKKVNDLGGHEAGDDMLRRVATCLRQTLGGAGVAARIGGDEFAGLLPVEDAREALEVAGRVLDGFGRIRLDVGDRVFTIGGSVGVAFIGAGLALADADPAALLGLADRACLCGKRSGGRAVELHHVAPGEGIADTRPVGALPEAGSFRGDELTLQAMPIIDLASGRRRGAEILLRLQGDRASALSSRAWISAAERSGFIAQVDAWTLDRVLDALGREAGRAMLTMNVSVASIGDSGFREVLQGRLGGDPLLASRLCLEIAERDFLREPGSVEAFVRLAADLGCQTAIDDFAGHWPVLSRLTGLKVDWLKLDAGLTREAAAAPAKAAVLGALVRAARDLGIRVIGKHVETPAQADCLEALGIDAAQGFHFGRPVPWPGG